MSVFSTFIELCSVGRTRQLDPLGSALNTLISIALAVGFFAIAAGVYVDQTIALHIFLGGTLTLVFLNTTGNARRPQTSSFISYGLALCSTLACLYFVVMGEAHSNRLPVLDALTGWDMLFSLMLIVLVLEATRRTIGIVLVALVGIFLIYALIGGDIGGGFSHRGMGLEEMLDHLVFTTNGLFGPALEVAAFLVFIFVLFGAIFDRFGGADFFYDISNALVGKQVGGSAKVAVVSSGLYGSVSGSPTADVVTTGFTKTRAAAIEAAASTGGSILPPVMGSAAFLMSDFTGIPYGTIAAAAAIPALLYYFCIYTSVSLYASKTNIAVMNQGVIPSAGTVLKRDWVYLVPLVTIAWAVLALNRPSYAGALACAAIIPVMLLKIRPLSDIFPRLIKSLSDGISRVLTVGVACAAAGLVIGTLSMTDLTGKISSALFAMAQGNFLLTISTAVAVIIILGMGMPVPAVYALAAVLAAPALIALDIQTLPAHLLIVYFAALSAITPPVAVAAFAAASIAQANPMRIGFLACRIAIVAFVIPFVFIVQPALLMIGSPIEIISVTLYAFLGCLCLTAVFEGYLFSHLGRLEKLIFLGVALLLFAPLGHYRLLPFALMLIYLYWKRRTSRQALPCRVC
jgi:TRAP transporter 4TM/12TM fusion protein